MSVRRKTEDKPLPVAPETGQVPALGTAQMPARREPLAMGEHGLIFRNWDDMWRLASAIAKSDLAPKDFIGKPENCLIAMQMGFEVGIAPMSAIQNIAVINGRPSIWGDMMKAICINSGLVTRFHEYVEGEGDEMTAHCIIGRAGWPDEIYQTFSIADAKRAGLLPAKPDAAWNKYPKRMLQMRARGFACRDAFPDRLRGIWSREEAIDMPPERYSVHDVVGANNAPPSNLDELTDRMKQAKPEAPKSKGKSKKTAKAKPEPEPDGTPAPPYTVDDLTELDRDGLVAFLDQEGLEIPDIGDFSDDEIRESIRGFLDESPEEIKGETETKTEPETEGDSETDAGQSALF